MENVVVLTFNGLDQAQEGFRCLQGLGEAGEVKIDAAALVERNEAGRTVVLEVSEDTHSRGAAAAGAIGGILGLLTGPLGAVAGGVTGAFVGSLVDVADVDSTEQLLRVIGDAIPPASAAAVAVVSERTSAGVNRIASDLGAALVRVPRRDVEAKLAEAEAEENARRREAEAGPSIGDRLRDVTDAVRNR